MVMSTESFNAKPVETGAYPKRKVVLNAFDCIVPQHQVGGTWVGESQGHKFDDVDYWRETAKLLEKGKFSAIFIADSYGFNDTYKGGIDTVLKSGFQIPKLDPLLVATVLAEASTNLTVGVTATTTYEPAYSLARRFTTLDHLSNGRAAWNIVTSHLPSAARQFGLKEAVEHDKRYDMADEYMDVMYKLWESSWHDDAIKRDREKGIWAEPSLVRPINHSGPYFPDIPGPFISHPSPQRTPLLYQAGSSGAGTTFGAKHAEAVFIAQPSPKLAAGKVKEYRDKAAAIGRDPRALKLVQSIMIFVAPTDEEADEKFKYWRSLADRDVALAFNAAMTGTDWAQFGPDEELVLPEGSGGAAFLQNVKRGNPHVEKWTRNALAEILTLNRNGTVLVGSPSTVANKIEEWVTVGDVDGFNISHYSRDNTFKDIVELLVPELQKRELLWDDYPQVPQPAGVSRPVGVTARESLTGVVGQKFLDPSHYGYSHKWFLEGEDKIKRAAAEPTSI